MSRTIVCLLMGVILLFVSCENEGDCGNDFSTSFSITFKEIIDSETTVNDTIIFNSVYALSNSDSLFVEDDTLFTIDLSIDPSTTQTTFIFDSAEGLDTVVLSYLIKPRLLSELCDPILAISELDTVNQTYDSLIILHTSLKKSNGSTLQIYR